MAVLLTAGDENGQDITPKNGLKFELSELQEYVDGIALIIHLPATDPALVVVVDCRASLRGRPVNKRASEISNQQIKGNAVICERFQIEGERPEIPCA